jgi:predicted outer membrane protein
MRSILKALLSLGLLAAVPIALAQDVATDTKKAAKDAGHDVKKGTKKTVDAVK